MQKLKIKAVVYIVGTVVLTANAMFVMPKIIGYLSDKLYKAGDKKIVDNDDWGPKIVKKEKQTVSEISNEEKCHGKL